MTTAATPRSAPGTITWDELNRLAYENAPGLPRRVNVQGFAKEWTGECWMNVGIAFPTDMVVLEDA